MILWLVVSLAAVHLVIDVLAIHAMLVILPIVTIAGGRSQVSLLHLHKSTTVAYI